MRILVINPNTTEAMTHEIDKVAQAAASKGTESETVQPKAGPRSIEGSADEVVAAYHTVDVVAGTQGKYDEEDIDRTKRMMVDEGRKAIEEDGAEAILLGCAGLGPLDKWMQQQLGVPVLDGVACGVKLAEDLHSYGITSSKVAAYKDPERKE